jgi:hypothetical protein
MCYGYNCGPMGWHSKEWTKEDKLKMLEKYERRMQEELADVQEMKKELAQEK